MANKLNSSFDTANALTVAQVLASKGRVLQSGFLDEFDREAMRHSSAISRASSLRPRKQGQQKSGFGRPQYHANASRQNWSMID